MKKRRNVSTLSKQPVPNTRCFINTVTITDLFLATRKLYARNVDTHTHTHRAGQVMMIANREVPKSAVHAMPPFLTA
jgi:hypothetical protein